MPRHEECGEKPLTLEELEATPLGRGAATEPVAIASGPEVPDPTALEAAATRREATGSG